MSMASEHAGKAALPICGALLPARNDRGVLPEHEIAAVLRATQATHANAIGTELETDGHRAAAAPVNAIIAGGAPLHRP